MKSINESMAKDWELIKKPYSGKFTIKCKKCGTNRTAYLYNVKRGIIPKCKTCFPPKVKTEPTFTREDRTFKEISEKLSISEKECTAIYRSAMEKMKCECQKEKYKTLRSCLEDLEAEVIDQIKF